jgi:hypothetical protein
MSVHRGGSSFPPEKVGVLAHSFKWTAITPGGRHVDREAAGLLRSASALSGARATVLEVKLESSAGSPEV